MVMCAQTRVLVTHGIHFLPEVDEVCMRDVRLSAAHIGMQVIVIRDGMVTESGTYSDLLNCVSSATVVRMM